MLSSTREMALFPVGAQDVDRDLLSVYGMNIMQGVDRRLRLGVKNVLVSIPPHSSRKTFSVLKFPDGH
jgi:hypothetical protein